MAETDAVESLSETPLAGLHRELGARMVPFAGYAMPVQYPTGIIAEHQHVRTAAGLFDVSHMGQARLIGPDHETTAAALETLAPGDFTGLRRGRLRYTLLTNTGGGIIDDLIVARPADAGDDSRLKLVVNAARTNVDYRHLRERLPRSVRLEPRDGRALLALQGPRAAEIMARYCPTSVDMGFMSEQDVEFDGIACTISRAGYTGEDGFEISVPGKDAEAIARALLADPQVLPIGLGARDSLRLEAGLPLYGHDIDETTSPVEADLVFAVSKRRREQGGFPGDERIMRELRDGPSRRRVGLAIEGKAPAREGAEIRDDGGRPVGAVTSGGYGATVGAPIAMGYVESALSEPGTPLILTARGRDIAAQVAALPFVPHRYFRKPKP